MRRWAKEREAYRLRLDPSVGAARIVEVAAPFHDYGPAEQSADGATGASALTVTVAQLGTVAPSLPPASFVFAI